VTAGPSNVPKTVVFDTPKISLFVLGHVLGLKIDL